MDKFVSNNVTKSFQQYLVLDILTNPNITLTEKVTFWGKIHRQCDNLSATLWPEPYIMALVFKD